MTRTYIPHTLVHAHLPAPPTIPDSIPELHVSSEYQDPAPTTDDIFPEHALSFSYNPALNVLARVINNGYTLELRSFSTVYDPSSASDRNDAGSDIVRVFFPRPIKALPENSVIVSTLDRRVYIMVYTEGITPHAELGTLYRLNFALGGAKVGRGHRFNFTTRGNDDWVEEVDVPEDVLRSCGGISTWAAVDELNAVLGGNDGGIVRLVRSNRDVRNPTWTAYHHRVSSRFRLPSLFSSSASDEQVVSFAKHVINDHLVLVYALSRDRKLRVWHGLTGALLKTTDVRSSSREIALRNSQDSSSSPSSLPLPENSSVSLVRVVPHPSSSSKVSHLVVVFLSTPKSSVSPGSFIVYRVGRSYSGAGDVSFAGERQCPGRVAGAELRGFEVLPPIQKEGLDSGWRLWTIWDKQGSTACESVLMDDLFQFTTYIEPVGGALLLDWQPATVDDTVQTFDSAYFDNLVPLDPPEPTRPGDNADIGRVFAEHLLYPGRFSILSLTSALDEYVADLPEQVRNTAISRSYVSLREKFETIVGCDLVMRQDDLTGAAKVQEYRSELKIAWLAVWTRVRYLDTSSRWPMGTALVEDQLVAVTREGCSVPVPFDTCGLVNALGSVDHVADGIQELPEGSFKRLHAALASPVARSDLIAVSNAGSHISSVLGSVAHDEYNETALEAFIEKLDTLVAKPYLVDIEESTTQFWSVNVEPYIPEHDNIAVRRFLSECPDISRGLTETLDVLATVDNTDAAVDVGLRFSGFGNALLAADLASTIRGRYQLARSAVLIAIFNMVDLGGLDGETDETEEYVRLLYRAFTTYGRYRVLHWTAEQAVDENRTVSTVGTNKRKHEAELADGFNTLRVAVGDETDAEDHDSAYSLLHSLLARGLATETRSHGLGQLYAGAQSFLRSILSLTPNTWDNKPLAKDVRFAFDVLQDDQPRHAGMITSFFPHSAGMLYVRGRACVELEEVEEAVVYFEKAAAAHDDRSLQAILRFIGVGSTLSAFYRHVGALFAPKRYYSSVYHFGNLALQTADQQDPATQMIWATVFEAALGMEHWDHAYVTVTKAPSEAMKKDFLNQLVSDMCEKGFVGHLLKFGFVGLQYLVEERLVFKARHADPLKAPFYHQILYSWHVTRGDYRSAGDMMYQQATRLLDVRTANITEMLIKRGESLLACINALSLLDKKQAWLSVSVPAGGKAGTRIRDKGIKRRRVTSYIPDEEFTPGTTALDILTLQDIRAEYMAVITCLQLGQEFPPFLQHGGSDYPPESLVRTLTSQGRYDEALSAAVQLEVDLSDIFRSLADACVDLSRSSPKIDSSWLRSSPVTAHLRGPTSALALQYLRVALQRHDGPKTNWRYRTQVLERFMTLNGDYRGAWKLPDWLVKWEMERDPEGLISRALANGWVVEAVEWSANLLATATRPELLAKKADAAYLPYNLFDRVVAATVEGPEKNDKVLQAKVERIKVDLARRTAQLKIIRC